MGGSRFFRLRRVTAPCPQTRDAIELIGYASLCVSTHQEVAPRIVSELCHIPPETLGQHRHLRGHAEADRCCGQSLIGSALVRFSVGQHARAESISKRAPSTTRTSLRFRVNRLRAVWRDYLTRNAFAASLRSGFGSAVCGGSSVGVAAKYCVRPANVIGTLKVISFSWRIVGTITSVVRQLAASALCEDANSREHLMAHVQRGRTRRCNLPNRSCDRSESKSGERSRNDRR
jgi:hypothetical protein